MALMQAQLATLTAQDAQREKMFAVQSTLLAQLRFQSTNATAPAPASGVENFQSIIKNAKLTKFDGDALVDKMSFAAWITSRVKAVIGVTTDQHVQQLAHQYLSGSTLSQSKATQRRPQADATPHERLTSWMAEMEKTYPCCPRGSASCSGERKSLWIIRFTVSPVSSLPQSGYPSAARLRFLRLLNSVPYFPG
jgi:hypothetical protein